MVENDKPNPLSEENEPEINPLTGEGAENNLELPEDGNEEQDNELPAIAEKNKAKNFALLGIILVVGLFAMISLFSKDKTPPPKNPLNIPGADTSTAASDPRSVPAVPVDIPTAVVTPPASVNTTIDPPPPPPAENERPIDTLPPLPQPTSGNTTNNDAPPAPAAPAAANPQVSPEEQKARLASKMLIVAAEGPSGGAGGADAGKPKGKVPELSEARVLGDTTNMVAQGKIIDAVLETAINTDLPGVLRAIVSRDIYAESGRNILVPKGSRLVGAYNAEIKRGQARVYIIWNRIIRPDGIDIQLDSPGTDNLGRTGLSGQVDSKYFEIFGNAVLFSAVSYAFAAGAETITGSQGIQETENPSGSRTVSGKPSDQALSQSIQSFGGIVKGIGSDLIAVKPTITIDQGTPIKVFVNRDLLFNQNKEKSALDLFK